MVEIEISSFNMSINNSSHAGGSRGVKRLHSCESEVTLSGTNSGEFSRSKATDDIDTQRSKMHSRLRASKSESDLTRQPKRQRLSRDFWRETSRRLQETLDGRSFQYHPQANPYNPSNKIYHRFSLPADLKLNTNFTNSNANDSSPPKAHHSTQNPEKSPFCFGSQTNDDKDSASPHTPWYEILDLSSYREKKDDKVETESDTDLRKEENSDKSITPAEPTNVIFDDISDIVITDSMFTRQEQSVADLDFYSLMNLYDGYLYRYAIKKASQQSNHIRSSSVQSHRDDADIDTNLPDLSNLTICDEDIEDYMRKYDVNAEDINKTTFEFI